MRSSSLSSTTSGVVTRSISLSVLLSLACALATTLSSAHAAAQNAPPQAYPPGTYPAQPYQTQPYQQPYPPPVYAPPPPPPGYSQQLYVTQPRIIVPRPRRGLMIAGISTLAASYAVGLVTGAVLIDTKCCENAGWSLFIPIAGPFMAAARVDKARGALAMLGVVQVVGAGLTIGGAVQFALSLKHNAKAAQALQFKLREGRSLALDVHTSPMLTGPSMKLRF